MSTAELAFPIDFKKLDDAPHSSQRKEEVYEACSTEWTYPGLPSIHPIMEIREHPKADKWRESISSKQRGSCIGTGLIDKGGGMTMS